MAGNFDGQPVTGTFSCDTDVPRPTCIGPDVVQTANLPGRLKLQFVAAGHTATVRGLGTLTLVRAADGR